MKLAIQKLAVVVFGAASVTAMAKLTPEQVKTLPPPTPRAVDFKSEIKPILEASCVKCHGRGKDKGAFVLDNRESFLKGGKTGPAVVPNNSAESYLIELVSGIDPDNVMPQKGSKLNAAQVGLLRAWIDQGLKWDPEITFAKPPPVNLTSRTVAVPGLEQNPGKNPIDLLLAPYLSAHSGKGGGVVDDRVFARRVYLDLIGVVPTPDELRQFEAETAPGKRAALVKKLLADNRRYAEHWLTFWNDALRNDYRGTGYIDGGRRQITSWLFTALAKNLPYDQFVAQLINPAPEAEGFTKGIIWRGVVNASQTPQLQAAQNISQIFMGVNLKCASCHDSFINDWALSDAYGLASIYAEGPLEMFHCDKPTGKIAQMKFIYPELGSIDGKAPKAERLKNLAKIVASKENGRLTRTIVNRLWAKLLGRGLVEPVDEMDNPAWNQDLLDWLAADLAEHGYDLKQTLERIVTSEAYQMPSVPLKEQAGKEFVFLGPLVRRLSAEQFVDALSAVTGVWSSSPAAQIDWLAVRAELGGATEPVLQPKWIWKDANAAQKTEATNVFFRKVVTLAQVPTRANLIVSCDNSFKLYINGKEVASGKDHTRPTLVDAKPHLKQGENLIAIEGVNGPGAPGDPKADQANPAGLIVIGIARHKAPRAEGGAETSMNFASDASWTWSLAKAEGWEKPGFVEEGWSKSFELGEAGAGPWALGDKLNGMVASVTMPGETRASLVNSDPLTTALGRPNREQVMTTRASTATTLQALELTNGSTLAKGLKAGAEALVKENSGSPANLISAVYLRGLGRNPTPAELEMSKEVVGAPVAAEGVEDLLWAVSMLPEFQLIY